MHQRSCRVVLNLNGQLRADLNDIMLTDQEYGNGSVPLKQRIHRAERHNVGEEQLPNDHEPVADTASRVCFTK